MEPLNLLKIGLAFIGGLVVALGSALVYVHKTDGIRTQALAQSIPAAQQKLSSPVAPATTPSAAEPVLSGPSNSEPSNKEGPAAVRTKPRPMGTSHSAQRPIRPVLRRAALERPKATALPPKVDSKETSSVVEIAQNVQPPPVLQSRTPVRIPAVNEDSNPGEPVPALQPQVENPLPAPPQPHVVTLAVGTVLNIRLGETLSTEHNYAGDTFRGTLLTPIIMNGFIIADRGSKVLGRIVDARRAGRLEGTADLSLTLAEINTTDGQRVQIGTDQFEERGASNTAGEAAKIGGGAALGAIIGALGGGGKGAAIGAGAGGAAGTGAVLLGHGRPAVVPAETALEFRLASPVTITEQLNH